LPSRTRQAFAARVIQITLRRPLQAPAAGKTALARLLLFIRQVILLTDAIVMAVSLDAYLGVHQQALQVQSRRMEVLAENLANVDTPNYKAKDIDFKSALAAVGSPEAGVKLATTDGKDIGTTPASSLDNSLKYRVPLAPSLDGNTVDAQQEQAAFAENTVHYQATLTLLGMRLKNLMTAITGQ
jgi:flagellar basal-body rod protein FlgB